MTEVDAPGRAGSYRPRAKDIVDALWTFVATAVGLGIAMSVVQGRSAWTVGEILLVSLIVFVADAVWRPVLSVLAVRTGAVGALLLGLAAQILVIVTALAVVPGLSTDRIGDAVLILVIASVVMAVGRWAVGANDSSYVLGHMLRRARRKARRSSAVESVAERPPGLLVVQFDGVSRSVIELAIESGQAPTLQRWIRDGDHELTNWWAQVPSTTPNSQAGLLHGDAAHIPAFRWWDRAEGRMLVANRPADAAIIEARFATGDGLLRGGGVAVGTMFSGEAETSLLVMSHAQKKGGLGPGGSYFRFFSSPFVFARSFFMTLVEMVKEVYQRRRQARREVRPRISRKGPYVLLRAVTNVMLRDLNTALVAEHLLKGAPVIFIDLVDYDEIAHHAGPVRPESMRSIEGMDATVRLWEQVAETAPRAYDIVVLSDHGQTLGATFEQQEGVAFADFVTDLVESAPRSAVSAGDSEEWGPVNALLTSTVGRSGRDINLGPDSPSKQQATDVPPVAVIASGNLGMIWFPPLAHRPMLDEVRDRFPRLVPELLARSSVGVVVGHTCDGPVVLGAGGERSLPDGEAQGADPLAGFPEQSAADLLRVASLPDAGDLIVVSSIDVNGHVHAFEDQVGSHGGLGGLQNEAMLLHPSRWRVRCDDGAQTLVGADQVHRQLLRWMVEAGIGPSGEGE